LCHHRNLLQCIDDLATLTCLQDVGSAVASKQAIPVLDYLVEALTHPPFRRVKNRRVPRAGRDHGSDEDFPITKPAYKDARRARADYALGGERGVVSLQGTGFEVARTSGLRRQAYV